MNKKTDKINNKKATKKVGKKVEPEKGFKKKRMPKKEMLKKEKKVGETKVKKVMVKSTKTNAKTKPKVSIKKKLSKDEIKDIIIGLAKQGISQEKIGLILRDSYGVPNSKSIGKMSNILKQSGIAKLPSDLMHLIKNLNTLEKHFEKNKQDKVAKRSIQLTKSKIRKLTKYYISKGVLKKDFDYSKVSV